MKKQRKFFRNLLVTIAILSLCFCLSVLLQDVLEIPEHVTTSFAFAVFLISFLTDGYGYGLAAALAGTLLVNYAFTFPYFAPSFMIPSNFYSALVLGKLTGSKLADLLTGLGVTAVIQSSSATTVMVVGFVNSGLMNLGQAINVIMGANIAQIVLDGQNHILHTHSAPSRSQQAEQLYQKHYDIFAKEYLS